MPSVHHHLVEPKYRRPGVLLYQDLLPDLPLGFVVAEHSLVTLQPGQIAGNHWHDRQEGFIAIGAGLELLWRDEQDITRRAALNPEGPDGQLHLYVVGSQVAHAIRNTSPDQFGVIIEYADMKQIDSPAVPLDEPLT